ncbi:MAG TPA: UDP-N-acetylglucosamine--N-acetylmuramyl-(pentapeptide) pyrophosphoryl-undecaprenol N-acetylglucosamine transferase [Gaiellaceae bacterium]|nr:UDP-N-acetylglucosamine--N-acetylmuramyl-(pentapeptide) pyrophosphoryl-undecaprenol N-acetylglucosamine transferase [Gaiellaceae bacterium]
MLPALAVAESLRKLGAEVTFASNADSRLVRDAGYELDVFGVEGFPRELSVRLAKAVGRAAVSVPACVRILRRRHPDVVLGGGGYVAGPMVLAAGTMRIPAALSEADARLGLANRLAAPFAKVVFLSFPIEGHGPPKYRVVGRPIPVRSQPGDPAEARRRFELPGEGPVVLVFGGSQGAQRLNEAALEAFGSSGPAVLHLAGERDYPALAERVGRTDYRLLPFTDDFGAALSAADLVVARAGGSVWEVAAAGRAALLVPYPHATADHQTENARYFERGGGAVVVPEPELDLRRQVDELLADTERLQKMGAAMKSLARRNAADDIAKELLRLAS